MSRKIKIQTGSISRKAIIAVVLVFILLTVLVLAMYRYTDIFGSKKQLDERDAKTTSLAPTAQENFDEGDTAKNPGNTVQENEGDAIINDKQGEISSEVDTSNPIASPSGDISIYEPKNDALVDSNFTIAGSSKLKTVNYRLVDNVSGVIATGQLNVVSGKFSGEIQFNSNASEGRLDIFGRRDDGTEFSNIQVPIRFK